MQQLTIQDIEAMLRQDESRVLEVKKTTGELYDGMCSGCAFLNTDGGWLLFGVTPKLCIAGQDVSDSTRQEIAREMRRIAPAIDLAAQYIDVPGTDGKKVIAIWFPGSDGRGAYVFDGRPYYKVENTTAQMPLQMFEERLYAAKPNTFAWEKQTANDFTLDALDENRIRGAIRLGVERGRMPETAISELSEEVLRKWKLMSGTAILNGAVALFGKDFFDYPQMQLRMARFRGTDKIEFIDNQRVEGNYFDLLDAGMSFLFRHLSISGKVVGIQREEHLEIPAEALREALTNALCHRQFERYNMTPGIAIYDDRVEIENPGRLPAGLTPDNIKELHASVPYNPLMAQVLFQTAFLENWGTGVKRMVDECRSQGVPEPEYREFAGCVTIMFRKDVAATEKTTEKTTKKIIRIMRDNPTVTMSELADQCSLTEDGIYFHVKNLRESGAIRREGSKKKGRWIVIGH